MTTMKYGIAYFGVGIGATVTVFGRDGTVAVSQGGVEMGQGLYTKVGQIRIRFELPISSIQPINANTLFYFNDKTKPAQSWCNPLISIFQ